MTKAAAPLLDPDPLAEEVAAFLVANPDFLAHRPDLYRALTPPRRLHGENLADHMVAMVAAERARLRTIEAEMQDAIATGRAGTTGPAGMTTAMAALTAVVLLPVLPWWEAVCLAAIVAPTEAALIEALLDDRRIPERVRHALSVESGFYDGFALAILLIALGLASQRTDPTAGHWAQFVFSTEILSLLAGAGIGLLGGLVVRWSRQHDWMSDTWAQLATLALAFICFQAGEHIEASGFVAAFTGGLAFSFITRRRGADGVPTAVPDATAQLLELLVFAMFGAFAVIDGWRRADWRMVVFAVLALFAVRTIAVLVSLVRTDMAMSHRLFIGWFGPRGIGTVVLGLLVIDRGEIQHADVIGTVVVVTVTLSLVLHSLSAAPGIRGLAARKAA